MPSATGTPTTPQFMQVSVVGHIVNNDGVTSKKIVNVFNFRRTSAWVAETINHAAHGIALAYTAGYLANMSVALVGDDVTGRFLDDPTLPLVSTLDTLPGGVAADNQPSIVAATVRYKTALRGKSYRGSKHFGPIAESQTLNQELTNAATIAFNTFATTLQTAVAVAGGNTWAPIVLSQILSDLTASPASITYADVTTCVVNAKLGTMRRRKEK